MKAFGLIIVLFISIHAAYSQKEQPLRMNDTTFVVINDMRVIGNEKTRPQVVFGESKLRIGDTISIKKLYEELQASRRNLLNLRLFTDVEILIDRWTNDNRISLVFFVDERWYIYPIPTLELTGITVSEWRDDFDYDLSRLTYGLSLYHYNLSKRGDILKLQWKEGFQENYSFSYNLPGIDTRRNWGVGFGYSYAKNKGATVSATDNEFYSPLFDFDVSEIKRGIASVSRRKDINRRHTLQYSFSDIDVADTIVTINNNYFSPLETTQQFASLAYNFRLEKRNLVEYPTDGHSINASTYYDGLFTDELNTFAIQAKYSQYKELNTKNIVSGSVFGRWLTNDEMPFYNLSTKALGNTVLPRGYQHYRIFPKSFVGFKTEYRYDLVTKRFDNIPVLPDRFEPVPFRILAKGFLDAGKTFSDQYITQNKLNNEFLFSYGIGFDVVTVYNTPFLFELSQNHLGEINFNVGLGKSF